uniref:Uncharacterized protein n=1 Tax=Equus caballus TaxID=9796 RepID=A0A3Q2KW13_HORSE
MENFEKVVVMNHFNVWAAGRARKFKSRPWGFFMAVLITCWGKACSSFFSGVEVIIPIPSESYKKGWKIMRLIVG